MIEKAEGKMERHMCPAELVVKVILASFLWERQRGRFDLLIPVVHDD